MTDHRGWGCSGLAVGIGARNAVLAATSEVLASRTVEDLLVGSNLAFEEGGLHSLKGVPGKWRVHAVGR